MSAKYGAVKIEDEDESPILTPADEAPAPAAFESNGIVKWFWNYLEGGDLDAAQKHAIEERLSDITNVEYFCIHAESVRQIAYGFFWFMILMAMVFTKFFVDPEQILNSDLKALYGFNNICVMFDYSPSREYTAMVYPLFEYSFFLYVVFDYMHLRLVCKGTSNEYLLKIANVLLPVKLTLIAWFRMIFVYNIQQPDVKHGVGGMIGHTLAFFGLQLALILVAFENIIFITATGLQYPRLGRRWTVILAKVYFVMFVCLSAFQMWFAFGLFLGYPTLDVENKTHQFIIWLDDRLWMILVSLMPFWFAQVGRKNQSHVRVTIQLNSRAWEDKTEVANGTVSMRNASVVTA